MRRRVAALCAIALAGLSVACTARRQPAERAETGQPYGIYRATYGAPDEKPHSFRVLLYAALPDRLHAEVLPPVGGPRLVLDGGGGRLAVTLPGRDESWAGAASGEHVGRVLGFPLELHELVGAVLQGTSLGGDVAMTRVPAAGGDLPRTFELRFEGRWLRLDLERRRRARGAAADMGTGTPPPGTEVHPLHELSVEIAPLGLGEG